MSIIHLNPSSECTRIPYSILCTNFQKAVCARQIISNRSQLYLWTVYTISLVWQKPFHPFCFIPSDPLSYCLYIYGYFTTCRIDAYLTLEASANNLCLLFWAYFSYSGHNNAPSMIDSFAFSLSLMKGAYHIAAAEAFNLPLTSIIAVGVIPAVTALIVTSLLAKRLSMRGTEITEADIGGEAAQHKDLPPLWAALSGPVVTIAILLLRPIAGITIDPLIALPVGGIVGTIAMGKTRDMGHYFNAGLAKMSGVAMLLVGTGALSGIISNSGLKDVIISFIETLGLPGFMLATISGMLMGAATASATAGTTLASQIFGPTVVASGVTPLAAAAMTHASCFVFDGLPHGSFFHVSAGGVNMEISERLKLLGYEAINGLAMMAASTLVFGVLKLAG